MIAPAKPPSRIYQGVLTDSHRWQHFRPRKGDILLSTPPKSGTTWTQGILALLISGDPLVDARPSVNAPWFDNRLGDTAERQAVLDAQTRQRNLKTHTPLDGVPYWPDLHYITVYRHPLDVYFSFRKHTQNYLPEVMRDLQVPPSLLSDDPRARLPEFLHEDGLDHVTLRGIVDHYQATLDAMQSRDILCLHYADMTRDLAREMDRVARHIGLKPSADVMETLVAAARFGNMKANTKRFALATDKDFWKDDSAFFDSGTSNKWEGLLTAQDLADYDAQIGKMLTPDQRAWLEWGGNGP